MEQNFEDNNKINQSSNEEEMEQAKQVINNLFSKSTIDSKKYIEISKNTIDNSIHTNNYHKAFFMLIMVLERLDNHEKIEFIKYYSKKIFSKYY